MSRSVVAPADITAPAKPAYVAGLDLGQSQDFSALAIVEHAGRDRERPMLVRHLQRWPLGTRYPAVVEDVAALLARSPLAGAVRLAIDKTGVGAGIVDLFRASAAASTPSPSPAGRSSRATATTTRSRSASWSPPSRCRCRRDG